MLHNNDNYLVNQILDIFSIIFGYLVKFGNHGVMYSRHRCFISMLEFLKPWIHSSRNSRVRWGSLAASFSLMDLIKIVLLAGIHRPTNTQKCLILQGSEKGFIYLSDIIRFGKSNNYLLFLTAGLLF